MAGCTVSFGARQDARVQYLGFGGGSVESADRLIFGMPLRS